MSDMDLNLNDKEVQDYGNQIPWLPFGKANYTLLLDWFGFVKGFKSHRWEVHFTVVETSRPDVAVETQYRTSYKKTDNDLQMTYTRKSLVNLMKAIHGSEADDYDKLLKEYMKESPSGQVLTLQVTEKVMKNKDDGSPRLNEAGKPVTIDQHYWSTSDLNAS